MKILAIETSCDETSVSVVSGISKDLPVKVLSLETATSIALHSETGGIIPENAARKQLEYMIPVLEKALMAAFPGNSNPKSLMSNIDAIAATSGPGLVGSLLVGVETAKTLACVFDKPIVPVNHVKAHIYGCFIEGVNKTNPSFPLLAAIVSGGHTDFVIMKSHGEYEWVGGTRDDAAGECFDKCARLIGLPYPGGPSIAKEAAKFNSLNPNAALNLLPRPMIHENNYDVSFSGLKTAVSKVVKENKETIFFTSEQIASEVEAAICDTLAVKIVKIAKEKEIKDIILCGGVSANTRVKNTLSALLKNTHTQSDLHVPEAKYSTDNASMVGSFAYYNYVPVPWSEIDVNPDLHF